MRIYLGIDPGKQGGMAALEDMYGGVMFAQPTPVAGNELDLALITKYLSELKSEDVEVVAVIEKVHSMPSQGVASMFSFGMSTGMMHGIVAALGYPRFLVAPQTWKNKILHDTAKDKDAAIAYCRRVYPYAPLFENRNDKAHTGVADAICIARYGYESYGRGITSSKD